MSLDRREFMVVLGAGMVLGLQAQELRDDFGSGDAATFAIPPVTEPTPDPSIPESLAMAEAPAPIPDESKLFAGRNLEGWRTALGDARHTASGLDEVNIADIGTFHSSESSALAANTAGRGVMAHNITYLRRVDEALDFHHRTSLSFRTPTKPEAISGRPNGQTLEIALFVWDGVGSRRDIGLAMQWMLNPWHELFGAIRTWTSTDDDSRWSPEPVAWLDPTDEWQHVEMNLDAQERTAALTLNGTSIPAQCTETRKPDNWANTVAAALQIELVSLWPDDRPIAPTTYAECKDWQWEWTPR